MLMGVCTGADAVRRMIALKLALPGALPGNNTPAAHPREYGDR
jgi:hypothetical protein